MQVSPLTYKELDATALRAAARPHVPGARRKEGPPPPPPVFTEEQVKAAERDGYKKGFLEGTEEGKRQAESEQAAVDRRLAETAEKFAHAVGPLLDDYRKTVIQLRADLPKVALSIARKVAGDALAENAQAAVEGVAMSCVEAMAGEPKLCITVHASLAATLEKKLKELAQRLQSPADILVSGDETMAAADCRIEWKYGACERHTGQLWERVEAAVAAMAAAAPHEAETQINVLNPAGGDSGSAGSSKEVKT